MVDDDPWAWTQTNKQAAPLAAVITPSTEQAPPPSVTPDPLGQQLQSMALNKGIDAAASGVKPAYNAYQAIANPVGPLSAETLGASFAKDMAAQGIASTAVPAAIPAVAEGAALASGALGAAAPAAVTAGTTAAGAGALGAGAAGASALGAGASAGGTAALAALGPVGVAIGLGLLAKKLKLF